MVKRLIPAIALLAIVFGCHIGNRMKGSGTMKTEKRELAAFKGIETGGAFNLEITCQKPQSVEIQADDNLLPLVEAEVRDGVLHVDTKENYHSNKLITLRISVPDLNHVTIAGAGNVHITGIKNDKFEVSATGAAKMQLSGETKSVSIDNSGAGLIDAHDLRAPKADVKLSGAGQVEVYASDQLDVSISGVGRVKYSGQPKVVNKNISGIGTISAED
jgi:Putative auto-transporter adhesin, head GIN domain